MNCGAHVIHQINSRLICIDRRIALDPGEQLATMQDCSCSTSMSVVRAYSHESHQINHHIHACSSGLWLPNSHLTSHVDREYINDADWNASNHRLNQVQNIIVILFSNKDNFWELGLICFRRIASLRAYITGTRAHTQYSASHCDWPGCCDQSENSI